MKFFLANIHGDVKGVNVLCSRYGNNITSYVSRDYNLLTNIYDNPHYKFIFHKQKNLNKLSTNNLNKFKCVYPYVKVFFDHFL